VQDVRRRRDQHARGQRTSGGTLGGPSRGPRLAGCVAATAGCRRSPARRRSPPGNRRRR
jgi:hypothetical protein